jgi:hypothetical protein
MKVFQAFEKMSNEELTAWTNKCLQTADIGPGLAILWATVVLFALGTAWIRLGDVFLPVTGLFPGLALANVIVCYERYRISRCFRELRRRGLKTDFFDMAPTDRPTSRD